MNGILLQGSISLWTRDIILHYKNSMPNCSILLSTWNDENTEEIEGLCEIVKTEKPTFIGSNIIFQKTGSLRGLNKLECEIILKCRTDQFLDAKGMFKMFENIDSTKILISNYATIESMDYFASDFCQLAHKNILLNFWNSITNVGPVHHPEQHLTKCYIINHHKDTSDWKITLYKYFHVADFHKDWKIRWLKLETLHNYKATFLLYFPKCVQIQ